MKKVSEIQQVRLRRRISDAMQDVDSLKAQLAEIRQCCAELEQTMRDIREKGEQAQVNARAESRRRQLKRVQ
ncbi:hypothetical protein [Bacterioplanoides sp.]|uniref:hypothetical protein n=1 Tax=Bacterioplanoides sp. TaxID=2066072 RepID=UPI003AFF8BF1